MKRKQRTFMFFRRLLNNVLLKGRNGQIFEILWSYANIRLFHTIV